MDPRHFDVAIPARSAMLFGNDGVATGAALAAIENVGLSCRIFEGVETAHLALNDTLVDVVVVEADASGDAELTAFLIRLAAYATETGIPVVACAPLDRLDLVADYLWFLDAELLCQPSDAERRDALVRALQLPANLELQDSATARACELESLRADVERLARTVQALAANPAPLRRSAEIAHGRAAQVRRKIKARRLRDKYFDSRLFADPAWDILLDLYAAHLEGREVSVSSLCIAAATPPTTALRWIASMTDANILIRRPDDADKRRYIISLSRAALDAIEQYFAAAHMI